MAVFTLYDRMRGHRDAFILVRVTGFAVIRTLIFDSHLVPIFGVGCSVPSVHISPVVYPETGRDIKGPGDEDKSDKTDYYPERP
jgi:hypothetical protein